MNRVSVAAFAALVAATVGAFFVTQHLKVTTPLIAGAPAPVPAAISPNQIACNGLYRRMYISFYLLHRADDVDVYVVDQSGNIVRTLASGRHMRKGVRKPDGEFYWNGREDNGSLAPDGKYYVRVDLIHQGRTYQVPKPVEVRTVAPRPVVTSVTPSVVPQAGTQVTIHYTGNETRSGTVRILRTDLPGAPRLLRSFITPWHASQTVWNELIARRPAPQGTYLIALDVTDKACNTGHFPPTVPPDPGSTPHAGVSVRYLAAEPPLDPVAAGSQAVVYVDSRQRPYRWTLRWVVGRRRVIASGGSRQVVLRVRLPRQAAGLYELTIRSGAHQTQVPLVAHVVGQRPRVLVVLPALTWQGLNPVDDDGDGLPDTLERVSPVVNGIKLDRVLINGLPVGLGDEEALLAYLERSRMQYDLTTDLGLVDGVGPLLSGHRGVVLAGDERWLPSSLGSALRSYVQSGGRAVSLGIDSLRRAAIIQGGYARNPSTAASADVFGVRPGSVVTHNTDLVTVISDGLGIFSGTSGAFATSAYQPILGVTPPATIASAAGTTNSTESVVGLHLGRGVVVEVGLPGFASGLARSVDFDELWGRLWSVMGG